MREEYFGSIFMDYRCSSDFSDRNTVIYGHNMKNNSMFGSLSYYSDPDYNKLHHSVYIFTPEKSYRYDIVSSYKTKINTKSYINQFRSDESFTEFLQFILESSEGIDTANAQIEASDKILTLSTCVDSGARNYRYVLHAVLSVTE